MNRHSTAGRRDLPKARLLLSALPWLLLGGCGTTGNTSRFTVALGSVAPTTAAAPIRVAPVIMAPDAARLYTVGVREWGRLDTDDLRNLEQSLAVTIAEAESSAGTTQGPPLDVYVIVRRYLVAVSNTQGGVLACVAWAAVDASKQIVLEEQFYAPSSIAYVGTIGGVKDAVHRATVRRIATTALYLAAGPAIAAGRPTQFDGTYDDLADAIATLPGGVISRGDAAAMSNPDPAIAVQGVFAVTAMGAPPWEAAKPTNEFDWATFLQTHALP